MTPTSELTPSLKFRVLDTVSNKIIRDSSQYHVTVERHNGIATLEFNRDGLRPLLCTGLESPAGTQIFDGDIVECVVGATRMTDAVYWNEGAWRFGTFGGVLSDYPIIAVIGNRFETPWPLGRPAPISLA